MESSLSGVGVLDKGVTVLAALERHGPSSLADVVAHTGLPRATAHRLAVALEAHGLVRRDGDGRFTLGLRLVGLGAAARAQFPLADAARPVLERLRDDVGESVQLYVVEGEARRCLVSLESPHGLRWIVAEGALLPLDRGSAGAVLAADRARPVRTGRGRAPGWVQSIEEREPGVCSVSAPVPGPAGEVVAAVSISGPVERLGREPGRRFGAATVAAAAEVASAMRPAAAAHSGPRR